jgi:hypothetical protein
MPAQQVADARELAKTYLQIGDAEERAACRGLIEPLLRELAHVRYMEGRPGHPDSYPETRDVLEVYVDTFPDSDLIATMTYRLAEVTAVLAGHHNVDRWLEAGRLYEQAAKLDPRGETSIEWFGNPAKLRDLALRGQAICLSNAASPYEEAGKLHAGALAVLSAYLADVPSLSKWDALDTEVLRARKGVLEAIGMGERDALSTLWEAIAPAQGTTVAWVALDLLMQRLAGAAKTERGNWGTRHV